MCLACSETTSSIPSDVDRLLKDMKCQTSQSLTPSQSLNAAANQLGIFQLAADPNCTIILIN